jgi:hypothetical protein
MPKHNPDRPPTDFYPTPEHVTLAILQAESFPGVIWEPACGDGAMVEAMKNFGHENIISTDKYSWGYEETGIDFLLTVRECHHIVTNPPFKLAEKFARHAVEIAKSKVALFLPLVFLESKGRRDFFKSHPPARVHVFVERVTIYPKNYLGERSGRGGTAYAWFVWDKSHRGSPSIHWL